MSAWMRKLTPMTLRRDRFHDPEFHKIKTQLTNVATALQACIDALATLNSDYDRLYSGLHKFANDFYSLYPSNDPVRRLGEATVSSTEALVHDADARDLSDPTLASVHAIDRNIKAYLAEIRNLQKEFKNVAAARIDYEVERDRLDRADRRGADDDRRSMIEDHMHTRKQIYDTTLSSLTNRLSSTYNKHAHVFQAAWTAYMLKVDDGRNLLDKHMRSHRAYAKKIEKNVVRMQLGPPEEDFAMNE